MSETPAPDPTLAHLLSLPPLLHPLSPHLSALHLARVRLLLSLPSPHPSLIWCDKCGGLREVTTSRKRKRVFKCTLCGLTQGGPKSLKSTVEAFPGARQTRRMAKASLVETSAVEAASSTVPITMLSNNKPMPPTLLSAPALKHVPTSHPTTPTYPYPPTPSPATSSSSASTSTGKKKKKSGLAKLLAENKARKEESSAGNWGLG